MSQKWMPLLASIEIDDTNNVLRFTEGSTTEDVEITAGTYYLRGDGADDDLCKAIKTALESNTNATNANTYTVAVAFDGLDATQLGVKVTITRATGSSNFGVLWADGNTTFDGDLVGFSANDTVNGTAKTSTASATAAWIATKPPSRNDPEFVRALRQTEMVGGQVQTSAKGLRRHQRSIAWDRVPVVRVFADEAEDGASDTGTLDGFLALADDGRAIEVHKQTHGTTSLDALSTSTLVGRYVIDEQSLARFATSRLQNQALHSFALDLRQYWE